MISEKFLGGVSDGHFDVPKTAKQCKKHQNSTHSVRFAAKS